MASKTVVISSVTRCAGGGHVKISGTLDGIPKTLGITSEELLNYFSERTTEDRVLARLYYDIAENNLTTPAQIKNRLEGRTYKI
jgi:hypothetical protein